jgi:hypothetical protein
VAADYVRLIGNEKEMCFIRQAIFVGNFHKGWRFPHLIMLACSNQLPRALSTKRNLSPNMPGAIEEVEVLVLIPVPSHVNIGWDTLLRH